MVHRSDLSVRVCLHSTPIRAGRSAPGETVPAAARAHPAVLLHPPRAGAETERQPPSRWALRMFTDIAAPAMADDLARVIDAELALVTDDGEVLDEVESYLALRSVGVEDGRYTGEIAFYCYGEGKVQAVRELAALIWRLTRGGAKLWTAPSLAWRETNDGRLLLKIVGPPYYSLLRALQPNRATRTVGAYLEAAPRVWVEVGFTHPLAAQIEMPPGKHVLIRAPRDWSWHDDGPFQHEIDTFELPNVPRSEPELGVACRLPIFVRLTDGAANDPPELWVLRDAPLDALTQLLQRPGIAGRADEDARVTNGVRPVYSVADRASATQAKAALTSAAPPPADRLHFQFPARQAPARKATNQTIPDWKPRSPPSSRPRSNTWATSSFAS